jgi:hypothetical protein
MDDESVAEPAHMLLPGMMGETQEDMQERLDAQVAACVAGIIACKVDHDLFCTGAEDEVASLFEQKNRRGFFAYRFYVIYGHGV